MAWKIFSIGKANARVDELEKELAAAKTTPPAADASQLADALASNEQISTQLTQANTDLATAKQTIGTTQAALEKAQGEVNTIGGSLKAACDELKLEVKAGATSTDMITSLKAGVSSTLAKLNVSADQIPAGKPATTAADSKTKSRADFAKLNSADQLAFCKAGGKIAD